MPVLIEKEYVRSRLAGFRWVPTEMELPLYVHPPGSDPVEAAVLVLFVNDNNSCSLLLTKRTEHLPNHAGQISFPGGKAEQRDLSREMTALRETFEEVGIPQDKVEVLGRLPDYDIPSGYRVTPIVGWMERPITYHPDEGEVESIIELPLEFLLDLTNFERGSIEREGGPRYFYKIKYQDNNIWGATAGMIFSLRKALID
jgi:8-oxo-dGTP pyrophosphatase MutT (NUDIX family)